MFASAGIERSSSSLYPNAFATSRTLAFSLDRPDWATEPYLDCTHLFEITGHVEFSFNDLYLGKRI